MSVSLHEWTLRTAGVAIAVTLLLSACASTAYRETHQINDLTIVFLDARSLAEAYRLRSGRPASHITMRADSPVIHRVAAFYDHETKTIFCQKWDFQNCGHELHHAVLGRFHAEHP